jgi:hypothetical protein
VEQIVKVLFENKDALVAAHPEATAPRAPVDVRRRAGAVPSGCAPLLQRNAQVGTPACLPR